MKERSGKVDEVTVGKSKKELTSSILKENTARKWKVGQWTKSKKENP